MGSEMCIRDRLGVFGDAFGASGGTGRELDEGNILRPNLDHFPGSRDVLDLIAQEHMLRLGPVTALVFPGCAGSQTGQVFAVRIQIGRTAQLFGNIENLLSMLVTDPHGEWYRDDAPELAGPEHIDELPIIIQKHDQMIALAHALLLQDMQQSQCTLVQGLETDALLIVLPIEKADRAHITATA